MAETKARFCDICKKLVSIQEKVYGSEDFEWRDKVCDYWQSKNGNSTVCMNCWNPLWKIMDELGTESWAELLAWLVNPNEEDVSE